MNKKRLVVIVFSTILLIMIVSLTIFGVSNYNMMQENESLAAKLIDIQKELAVTQDELFIAEESFRIETDRHLATQRDLEEANEYINVLIDEKYVVDKVIAALAVVKADDLEENESLLEACKDALFTKEDILAAGNITDEDTNDGPNDNTGDADDRFVSDNKQIVIVTYGDRNDKTQEKEAYKSFILNYNSYAVVVEYEGVTYTIPRGGYVVVYHD